MASIKVFKFGLLAPIENGSLVHDQMVAAHRYHNILIEIERGKRAAIRSITRESTENIRQLEQKLLEAEQVEEKIAKEIRTQHSDMRSRFATQTDKEDLKNARLHKKECRKALAEARKVLKNDVDLSIKIEEIKEREKQLIHSAREFCGVYWGTYLLVEDAIEASRKIPLYDGVKDNDPKFVPWKRDGAVGVQLQGGLDVKDAFGTDTQIRIDPVDEKAFSDEQRSIRRKMSRTTLRIRVGSDSKKKPIWAAWPMIMHRPLPKDSLIKKATVHLKHIGPREEWSITITVDMSGVVVPSVQSSGAVSLDIGWRDMKDTNGKTSYFRIGKFRDENGKIEELKLDHQIIDAIHKANEIRSVRDDNFNQARSQLVDWMTTNQAADWLVEETKTISQWRSINRLVRLVKNWKINRFDGDQDIYEALEKWRYHDYHLWSWETSQRTKSLRRRKENYRIVAADLADKYQTLVLEDFDLRDVSQKAEPDEADDNQRGRANKTLAAPSELRLALANAFSARKGKVETVDPKGTSYTCHLCGSYQNLDSTTHLHTCSSCNQTWDREDNATANMLNRWKERKSVCEQSSATLETDTARNSEISKDSEEIKETRYQRRNRAKQEKLLRQEAARKLEDKVAE